MRVFLTGAPSATGESAQSTTAHRHPSFAGERRGTIIMSVHAAAEGGPAPVFVLRCKGATPL
jgi:hypothetical protein